MQNLCEYGAEASGALLGKHCGLPHFNTRDVVMAVYPVHSPSSL